MLKQEFVQELDKLDPFALDIQKFESLPEIIPDWGIRTRFSLTAGDRQGTFSAEASREAEIRLRLSEGHLGLMHSVGNVSHKARSEASATLGVPFDKHGVVIRDVKSKSNQSKNVFSILVSTKQFDMPATTLITSELVSGLVKIDLILATQGMPLGMGIVDRVASSFLEC